MRSIVIPLTKRAGEFFRDRGLLSVPAFPFLTTLAEKEADGMEPLPLERGKDFLEYILMEEGE